MTRDVVVGYLDGVRAKDGWELFLSDALQFTNFTDPVKRAVGKQASLEGIRRFYAIVTAFEIKSIIVDGQTAYAFTRYELQPPGAPAFESHIAEVFEVSDGKINTFGIYFDSAPYPKPSTPRSR
jgi:limonene-1,2-epoxide hydrolase